MPTRLSSTTERAAAALAVAVEDQTKASVRAAAEAIVNLRKCFRHEGLPDWAGRSPEYRDCIERLYRQARVPSDSAGAMQANLRYHLGNILRQVAPPEELEALGLSVRGPKSRIQASRVASPRTSRAAGRPGAGDPAALAALALEAVRTLRTMEPGPEILPALRRLVDEAMDAMASASASVNGTSD